MSLSNKRSSKDSVNVSIKEKPGSSIIKRHSQGSNNAQLGRSLLNEQSQSNKGISIEEEFTKSENISKKSFSKREFSTATTTALVGSDDFSEKRRRYMAGLESEDTSNSSKTLSKQASMASTRCSGEQTIKDALKYVNQDLPNVEHDIRYTKLYLQKQGHQNLSIWSHLTNVLNKIIADQPDNVIDYFEEYSRKVKQERLLVHDSLREVFVPSSHLASAKNQLSLVNAYGRKEDTDEEAAAGEDEEADQPPKKMDLEEAAFYFRQAGVSIPDYQLFSLNIAIKKLAEEKNLIKSRFWGKMKGTKQDYFILEAELTEEEYERRAEEDKLVEAESARLSAEETEEHAASEGEERPTRKSFEEIEESEIRGSSEYKDEGGEMEEDTLDVEQPEESRQSDEESHEVKFDLPEEQETAEEDPLLPPLPPPKKLLKYTIPPILKPVPKEIIKIPSEKVGQGVNRKIYFVSNTPELEWTELPKVTPEQINVARQIKIYLTGDIETAIITYPAFPGNEKNYLRAQIARISASTHVSPLGFYMFGEGGEEEEEEVAEEEEDAGEQTKYTENPNFRPIPIRDLIDPSLASWVHHSQHILKQGRTEWWSTKKAAAGEEEAEEEEEDEEEVEEEERGDKEKGPPLLSPLSDDATIEGLPAWTARKTHNYNNQLVAAIIKSNLWPGSYTFAIGKKYENIYFGWGHKHLPQGFSPAFLPHPEYEYELGPEIMEIQDPTMEVEESWRQAHRRKSLLVDEEEEEGEGEEAEEDEEEEDMDN